MSLISYTKFMISLFDEQMMSLAIALGEKSRCIAPPNPWVGCVIVQGNAIVGQGSTQKVGELHAEVLALKEAGGGAKGSSVYVTLEPCSHFGRTPPCVDALIASQVKKVYIATTDPDPKVNGQGIAKLKNAGIEVVLGVCEENALQSLMPYLYQRKTKLPFLIAKCACSVDGRIAASDGSSKWISSEKARQDVQLLRIASQGILVGSKTAQQDLPKLTVREGDFNPLRIVFDSKGILEAKGPLFSPSLGKTLIVTTGRASQKRIQEWLQSGAMVETVSENEMGKINLSEALKLIASKGVLQLLCEGGGELLGVLLEANLINHFVFYVSPCLLGDQGKPLISGLFVEKMDKAKKLNLIQYKELDGTMRLDYQLI